MLVQLYKPIGWWLGGVIILCNYIDQSELNGWCYIFCSYINQSAFNGWCAYPAGQPCFLFPGASLCWVDLGMQVNLKNSDNDFILKYMTTGLADKHARN